MKNFNLLVTTAIILCMQTLHANAANADHSSCGAKLERLVTNADTFISNFLTTQNEGKSHLPPITNAYFASFGVSHNFLQGDYSTNSDDAESTLELGSTSIEGNFGQIFSNIQAIGAAMGKLGQLGEQFKSDNDLTCRFSWFLRGCEAKLNAARCEIAAFVKGYLRILAECQEPLKQMMGKLQELLGSVKVFDADKYQTYCELQKAIQQLYAHFNSGLWEAYTNFITLGINCDRILYLISKLKVDFKCIQQNGKN